MLNIKSDPGTSGGHSHRPLDEAGAIPDSGPTLRAGGLPDVTHTRRAGRPFLEEQSQDSLLERRLENTVRRVDLLERYILAQSKDPMHVAVTTETKDLTWSDVSRFVLRKLFGIGEEHETTI